jgi:hypothetical protein
MIVLCLAVITLGCAFQLKLRHQHNFRRLCMSASTVAPHLTMEDWMENTLGSCTPHSLFTETYDDASPWPNDDPGCLTDSGSMAYPLIDFDAKTAADLIIESGKTTIKKDGRRKPSWYVCRGMGGGKTRSLMEVRRQLIIMRPDALPICITFGMGSCS